MTYQSDYRELNTPEEKYNTCAHCDAPCDNSYCSRACKSYDLE